MIKNVLTNDFLKKIFCTLILIGIYRFGIFIAIPGVNEHLFRAYVKSLDMMSGILGFFNVFSGGAMENASIFALGIMPYITSSIIISLTMTLFPSFEEMRRNNSINESDIKRYTFFLAILITFLQGYVISEYLKQLMYHGEPVVSLKNGFCITSTLTLVAGTSILIWISEKISYYGIGNGVSLLIISGILAKIPKYCVNIYLGFVHYGVYSIRDVLLIASVASFFLIIIVFIESGEKRIPIATVYHKKSRYYNRNAYLPLKINFAGIMPPILASAILSIPITLSIFLRWKYSNMIAYYFKSDHYVYQIVFTILIIVISYFYTIMRLNPKKISDNMLKNDNIIPGIRPGSQTSLYIERMSNRIILWGTLYLLILCILPMVFQELFGNHFTFSFGGTTLLIVVNVSIDILNKIESHFTVKKYSVYRLFDSTKR
jgi:preprotein translocase subunit SecY